MAAAKHNENVVTTMLTNGLSLKISSSEMVSIINAWKDILSVLNDSTKTNQNEKSNMSSNISTLSSLIFDEIENDLKKKQQDVENKKTVDTAITSTNYFDTVYKCDTKNDNDNDEKSKENETIKASTTNENEMKILYNQLSDSHKEFLSNSVMFLLHRN